MSANPEQAAPQQETARDFDSAADALFAEAATPQQPAAEATAARDGAPAEEEGSRQPDRPDAPATESDDDDPQLAVEERIARAERRAAKQTQAEIAAERERAKKLQDQVNGYNGALKQEQERRRQIEADLEEARKAASDFDSYRNKQWEDLIRATDDATTRAEYERLYGIDRREREVAAKEKDAERRAAREREEAETQRAERSQRLEGDIRYHALADIAGAIPKYAQELGLEPGEYAFLNNWLASPEVVGNIRNLPIFHEDARQTLDHFRGDIEQRAATALQQIAEQKQRRAIDQNRAAARETFPAEQPIAGGGDGARGRVDIGQFRNTGRVDDAWDALNNNWILDESERLARR